MRCEQCPRRCGAERGERTSGGVCGAPELPKVARAALHFWEEPAISGTRGSGTIFFSGCPLKCVFCQNEEISRGGKGEIITVDRLIGLMRELEQSGAHNINFVTPTHYVHAIREALQRYRPSVPVVYNCGGYEEVSALESLEGLVDIYLPDMKYSDNELALRFSKAGDYVEKASAAIAEMFRQTGPAQFDAEGMMTHGTVVRHLILPGHVRNSIGVLKWIRDELPQVTVSVMSQYFPTKHFEEYPELNRRITAKEQQRVQNFLEKNGMTDGWVQDRESADGSYVPQFFDELGET